jgi:hypothetical protein
VFDQSADSDDVAQAYRHDVAQSVDSEAATRLTTSTFAIMNADPKLGRAAAMRNAMLAYERQVQPAECLPGIVGAFFHHRKGSPEMKISRSNCWIEAYGSEAIGDLLHVNYGHRLDHVTFAKTAAR